MGYISFFENFVQIVVLLFAWVVVLLAFFILAIQLFVTLIEFKLTTLAGFVLIPFGLFGKTAFAAERVLGNVVSSGIKVLVLAVIVGIGSTLFSQFTSGFNGGQPTIEDAMALVLAALSLLGLGIFGPGIANGVWCPADLSSARVPRSEQALLPAASLSRARVWLRAEPVSQVERSRERREAAALTSGASAAYRSGGLSGVADAGLSAAASPLRRPRQLSVTALDRLARRQPRAAPRPRAPAPDSPPDWARRMKRAQTVSHGASAVTHAVRSGDHGGGGASIDLSEGNH